MGAGANLPQTRQNIKPRRSTEQLGLLRREGEGDFGRREIGRRGIKKKKKAGASNMVRLLLNLSKSRLRHTAGKEEDTDTDAKQSAAFPKGQPCGGRGRNEIHNQLPNWKKGHPATRPRSKRHISANYRGRTATRPRRARRFTDLGDWCRITTEGTMNMAPV